MTERPILFSAPMVRAILEGRKTQTRRVIKPQPVLHPETDERIVNAAWQSGHVPVACPFGKVGDLLWVRETWRYTGAGSSSTDGFKQWKHWVKYTADDAEREFVFDSIEPHGVPKQPPQRPGEVYSLRDAPADFVYDFKNTYVDRLHRWWKRKIPGIHMPRWASRITLKVTDVRVERLQWISEDDIQSEGVTNGVYLTEEGRRSAWQFLWEQINGAESWAANPWCWCISFERVKP